jgi:hypothetical protein
VPVFGFSEIQSWSLRIVGEMTVWSVGDDEKYHNINANATRSPAI